MSLTIHLFWTQSKSPFSDHKRTKLMRRLPERMQARAQRYHRWQDMHLSFLGKLLLLDGMREIGQRDIRLEEMVTDQWDKPSLPVGPAFNISHSGTLVLCAIAETELLGADVEARRSINVGDFEYVMNPAEWAEITQAERPEQVFFRHWTRKESVVKAVGRGLSLPLNELEFGGDTCQVMVDAAPVFLHVRELELLPDYACALAAGEPIADLKVVRMDY